MKMLAPRIDAVDEEWNCGFWGECGPSQNTNSKALGTHQLMDQDWSLCGAYAFCWIRAALLICILIILGIFLVTELNLSYYGLGISLVRWTLNGRTLQSSTTQEVRVRSKLQQVTT